MVSQGMIKFVTKLNKKNVVDVEGVAIVLPKPVGQANRYLGFWKFYFWEAEWLHLCWILVRNALIRRHCTLILQVEVHVTKIYCISQAAVQLPINLEDWRFPMTLFLSFRATHIQGTFIFLVTLICYPIVGGY
jgi:hypothetical protein